MIYDTGTDTIKVNAGAAGSPSWVSLGGTSDRLQDEENDTFIDVDTSNDGETNSIYMEAGGGSYPTEVTIDADEYNIHFNAGSPSLYVQNQNNDAYISLVPDSNGNQDATGAFRIYTGAPKATGDLKASLSYIEADDIVRLTYGAINNNHLTINSSGHIGIGKTAATGVELDVSGDIQYTGTITDVSDRRLKTDITPLDADDIVTRLAQINTYTFHMKTDPNGPMEYGVMAQELEEIFPELVRTANDEMGTKSVNYVGLIAPMIEATKTLKSENEDLRNELAALKSQQNDILKEVNALKTHTGYGTQKAMFGGIALMLFAIMGGVFMLIWNKRKQPGA